MFCDLCELPVTFYHKNKINSSLSKVPGLKKNFPKERRADNQET